MSEDSLDTADPAQSNTNPRSRSILRQVGETLGVINRGRNRAETSADPPSVVLFNSKRGSVDSLDAQTLQGKSPLKKLPRATTPTSFSHRLSLLNQVKSHLNKARKAPSTIPLTNDDEDYAHLSLPPLKPVLVSERNRKEEKPAEYWVWNVTCVLTTRHRVEIFLSVTRWMSRNLCSTTHASVFLCFSRHRREIIPD